MKTRRPSFRSTRGFTLIEVIAVLVLLGVLAAVAVPRYIDVVAQARDRAVDAAVAELNGRESLAWAQQMIATAGAPVDATVFAAVNATSLGSDYAVTGATVAGATVSFQGATGVALTRTASSATSPGNWSR